MVKLKQQTGCRSPVSNLAADVDETVLDPVRKSSEKMLATAEAANDDSLLETNFIK